MPEHETVRSSADQWVDLHGSALFRFALLRVRDPSIAEDLVQETFLAALGARAGFAGESTERTWFTGILRRKVVDHFRKAKSVSSPDEFDSADDFTATFFDAGDHFFLCPLLGPGREQP